MNYWNRWPCVCGHRQGMHLIAPDTHCLTCRKCKEFKADNLAYLEAKAKEKENERTKI